nr:hypothetical protein [Tanacetum cinerariifolium]
MAFSSSSSSSDNKINDKHGLGYFSSEDDSESLSPSSPSDRPSTPIIKDWVSDSEDEYEPNDPQSVPSFVQSSEQVKTPRHSVQPFKPPILDVTLKPTSPKSNSSSKRKNRKTCFVCRSVDYLIKDYDYHSKKKTQPTPRNYAHMGNKKQNASFTHKHPLIHMVPAVVLTQSKPVSITAARPVCAAMLKIMVTRPRHAHLFNTKSKSAIIRHITRSPSRKTSHSSPRFTTAQASVVSAAKVTAVSRDDVQDQSIPSPTPPTPPPQPPQDIPSTSQEALDVCDALTRRVEHLEHDKVAKDLEITKLKTRVKKLERANKVAGDEQVKGRQAKICQIYIGSNAKYSTTSSARADFGVDAAMELEERHLVYNAAGEELSAAKQKLMLLDTAVERRLMLLSQVKTRGYVASLTGFMETAIDKEVLISEGSPVTRTKSYMETYKTVSQDIHDQLNAEAKAVQIILTGIDNDIYSIVDACPNACEMWKAIKRNQCDVTNHQVNVQFLLQLQPEWQRFVTLLKQSQELKTVSYHKLYDILKQHQNKVNEIRAKRITRTTNTLALVSQQQPVYHPQTHPTHYTQNSSTRSQQAAAGNRGKSNVNSPQPIYDQEPSMVAEDDETSKDKEIDKLMALISLSFKKIYKPTNNNLRTSSNTSRANQDNSSRNNRSTGYENQGIGNVAGVRETVAYHREKMLLCKHKEARIQLNAEQADWRDDTDDDELENQELEAHYMYMAQIQKVSPDAADSGPIFDAEPLQKNDDNNDLDNERELLASLIEKLKSEIDESKNRNKFLETSNKVLVAKLKGEIKDFKNKNKSLESSNNHFKEPNKKLSETNKLLYDDFKKLEAELARRNSVEYASKMEIECAQIRGDLISYKVESQKSFNKYTQTINDLNQMISEMKNKLCAHQETISILSQQKEAQIKLYKTREDKELDKVIALESKVKVLDNIVYKIGQSVQTMNMLNNKCRTSFAKLKFLKKSQRANPRLYDIGCFNDNLVITLSFPSLDDQMNRKEENIEDEEEE